MIKKLESAGLGYHVSDDKTEDKLGKFILFSNTLKGNPFVSITNFKKVRTQRYAYIVLLFKFAHTLLQSTAARIVKYPTVKYGKSQKSINQNLSYKILYAYRVIGRCLEPSLVS